MTLAFRILLSIPCILCIACGGSSNTESNSVPRVSTYEECVLSGGIVQEIYPPICVLPDGSQFEAPLFFEEDSPCEDRCGDGSCQEYTCLAIGCPCSEVAETCPIDCS